MNDKKYSLRPYLLAYKWHYAIGIFVLLEFTELSFVKIKFKFKSPVYVIFELEISVFTRLGVTSTSKRLPSLTSGI